MPESMALSHSSELGEFPNYADSDILVVLSPTLQYRLHSAALRLNSAYFKNLLQERESLGQDSIHSVAKQPNVMETKLFFEPPKANQHRISSTDSGGFYVQVKSASRRPQQGRTSRLRLSRPVPGGKTLHRQLENVFRSFYHAPLILSASCGVSSLLQETQNLANIAESLGATECVSASLDSSLLKKGQELFRAVANDPGAWGDVGVRIKSDMLVREAVCHLVGLWNDIEIQREIETTCDHGLTTLVRKKWEHLNSRRVAMEMRIIGFYPATLLMSGGQNNRVDATAAGKESTKEGRKVTRLGYYSKNMVDWMAVNLFRHWMGQHICAGFTRAAADGGYSFYNSIHEAGEAYIDQEAREAFASRLPLSAKARTNFDAAVGRIKEELRHYVGDLVQAKCSLDVKECPVKWLTCTEVAQDEMPWRQQRAVSSAEASVAIPSPDSRQRSQTVTSMIQKSNLTRENGGWPREKQGLNVDSTGLRQPLSMAASKYAPTGERPDRFIEGSLEYEIEERLPALRAAQPLRRRKAMKMIQTDDEADELLGLLDDEFGEGLAHVSADGQSDIE